MTQTVSEAVADAAQRLGANPELQSNARRDADLLLMHSLGRDRAWLFAHGQDALTACQQAKYESLIERRLGHVPLQYITGEQEFWGLPFRVTPAVLIPRPETEHLVEAALEVLPRNRPLAICDVGTGSGAIGVALAHSLADATVTALDISPAALAVAQENAARNGVSARISFVESDLFAALSPEQSFDAIVSNPPYIAEADRNTLSKEVREHEPEAALFAGEDGLAIYRRLIAEAKDRLNTGSSLLLEIGAGQQSHVKQLLLLKSFTEIRFLQDLQGIPRVAVSRAAG